MQRVYEELLHSSTCGDLLCTASLDGRLTRLDPASERSWDGRGRARRLALPGVFAARRPPGHAAEVDQLARGTTTIRWRTATRARTALAGLESTAIPLPDGGGALRHCRDVTAQRRLEEEVLRMPDPGGNGGGELHDGCASQWQMLANGPHVSTCGSETQEPGTFWTMPPSMGVSLQPSQDSKHHGKEKLAALQAAVESTDDQCGGGPAQARGDRW